MIYCAASCYLCLFYPSCSGVPPGGVCIWVLLQLRQILWRVISAWAGGGEGQSEWSSSRGWFMNIGCISDKQNHFKACRQQPWIDYWDWSDHWNDRMLIEHRFNVNLFLCFLAGIQIKSCSSDGSWTRLTEATCKMVINLYVFTKTVSLLEPSKQRSRNTKDRKCIVTKASLTLFPNYINLVETLSVCNLVSYSHITWNSVLLTRVIMPLNIELRTNLWFHMWLMLLWPSVPLGRKPIKVCSQLLTLAWNCRIVLMLDSRIYMMFGVGATFAIRRSFPCY